MGYPEINRAVNEAANEKQGVGAIDSTGAGLANPNHWDDAGLKPVTRRPMAASRRPLRTSSARRSQPPNQGE